MIAQSLAEPDRILSREEGQRILAPYLDRLNRCIQYGWDVWKSDYLHKHHILGPRARAAIVFDEIAHCAMQEFIPGPELNPLRTSTTFWLYVGDSLSLRFKKLRRSGRSSNIPTEQQQMFSAQAQLRLFTMTLGTVVEAGYELNNIQQDIRRKAIVCQKDNKVAWRLPLDLGADGLVEFASAPPMEGAPAAPRFEAKLELAKEQPTKKASGEAS